MSNTRFDGDAFFVMFHAVDEPVVAVIVLSSSWGRISRTGIETSRAPTPAVPNSWFMRFECSDEPGYSDEPSASRS